MCCDTFVYGARVRSALTVGAAFAMFFNRRNRSGSNPRFAGTTATRFLYFLNGSPRLPRPAEPRSESVANTPRPSYDESRRAHVISRYSCARYDRRRTMISEVFSWTPQCKRNFRTRSGPSRKTASGAQPSTGQKTFFRISLLPYRRRLRTRFRPAQTGLWPVFLVRLPLDFPKPVTSKNRAFWNTRRGSSVRQHHRPPGHAIQS